MFKFPPILLLTSLLFFSCEKFEEYPDNPVEWQKTVFLAHHGGGDHFEPNTEEAIKFGLDQMPGIECDIQLSKDNSLWTGHSASITGCDGRRKYFPNLTDKEIVEINDCQHADFKTYMLDSMFSYISKNLPGKYISLDVKAWTPPSAEILGYWQRAETIGKVIIMNTEKYNMNGRVMVESEMDELLQYIDNKSDGIGTYLLTYGDYRKGAEKALKKGYTGISLKYENNLNITSKDIQSIHNKGLKIHLWTINDTSAIKRALLLKPDFIQTDNLDFAGIIQ